MDGDGPAPTRRYGEVEATAAVLVRRVLAAQPTLGATRLVCVDGAAGAGKTTLGAALDRGFHDALPAAWSTDRPAGAASPGRHDVLTLHMDDLFHGWHGVDAGIATLTESVLAPVRRGEPGRYRRWDWHRDGFAEERLVHPVAVLVVEGVGSGALAHAAAITCLAWVDAPSRTRLERGLARDGEALREHWLAFRAEESARFARERTRERADVVVDGLSGRLRSS
ncbi:MAG: 4-amino-4-deoxy-L-arabinose transferase [Nocardioidaceae bacterium]